MMAVSLPILIAGTIMLISVSISGVLAYLTSRKLGGEIGRYLKLVVWGFLFLALFVMLVDFFLIGIPLFETSPAGSSAFDWVHHILESVGYGLIFIGFVGLRVYLKKTLKGAI